MILAVYFDRSRKGDPRKGEGGKLQILAAFHGMRTTLQYQYTQEYTDKGYTKLRGIRDAVELGTQAIALLLYYLMVVWR